MADPNWSNAVRDDIAEDEGYSLGLSMFSRAIEFFLHPQAAGFLHECTDEIQATIFSVWRITACKPGVDTDANGFVWWQETDETPGAGQARLRAYRGILRDNSAGNELVAQGNAANGATITLVPEVGYTLAGTVLLGAPTVSRDFRGQILVPPIKRFLQLFDGSSADDEQIRAFAEQRLRSMRGGAQTMKAAANEIEEFVLRTKVRRQLPGTSHPTALLLPGLSQVSGVVTYRPAGLREDLRRAMDDNTGGAGEIKVAAGAFAGALAYAAGGWAGSPATPSYGQRALASTVTLRCTLGLNASGPPKFTATRRLTDRRRAPNEGKDDETLPQLLWIGKEWQAKEWGIDAVTVQYLASIANVTSALLSTTPGDWSATGLTTENSTDGQVFVHYDGATLKAYATAAGRTAQNSTLVVAQRTTPNTDDLTVVTLEQVNESGLTIVGKTGAGVGSLLVTGSVGDVHFNPPSANEPVSQITIPIVESTEVGEWGAAFRDAPSPWVLNTGAAPNLVDGAVVKGLPMINAAVLGDRT